MQLCAVCFWEDSPGRFPWNDSNAVPLSQAQLNFCEFGSAEPDYVDVVRAPTADESRARDWISITDLKAKIIEMINNAFENVMIEKGLSLHQARAIADYSDKAGVLAARLLDPEIRWQDIQDDKIIRFNDSMTFLDPEGFRFYLPYFIIYALRHYDPRTGQIDADGIIWALTDTSGYYSECLAILSAKQRAAAAAFLNFVSLYTDSYSSRQIEEAINQYCDQWLPDFLKNNSI